MAECGKLMRTGPRSTLNIVDDSGHPIVRLLPGDGIQNGICMELSPDAHRTTVAEGVIAP